MIALLWIANKGKEIIQKHEEKTNRKRKKAKVYRKYQYSQLDSFKEHSNSGRMKLESFERATRYLFEHSNVVLGELQERMFKVVQMALLGKMFETDLIANLKYLRKRFPIDQLNNTIGIKLPRRSGKTECTAIIIAIILVSQPAGNCNMYNLAGLQAKEVIQSVDNYLQYFKDSEEFGWTEVRRDARSLIEICNNKYNAVNSIKSYACASKGNGKIGSRCGKSRISSSYNYIIIIASIRYVISLLMMEREGGGRKEGRRI